MKLSDLIPSEFKAACLRATDPTHGRISVIRTGTPNAGKVLVEWPQKCPLFKPNLALARDLKNAGKGTYNPNAGGWVFHRNVAAEIHEKFAVTIERTPEFIALTEAADGKSSTDELADLRANETPAAPKKHGRVTIKGKQFLVQWGGEAGICPRANFERYLNAARSIRTDYTGSNGWNKPLNGWLFALTAAAAIARRFPIGQFDHCPELTAAANANPEPNPEPEPASFAPDSKTLALLAAAERVFSTFAK
jgi:hypothetical protein